ncbi:hypothetical protein H5410_061611 [Solanum commersonii]|uniref:Uncharacterized protein n=1 Tax=Solanum commersonii TaxID=4109 RepID=A0A9J5W8C1_SOLCO|nr:hypothetical protein H5410_061611 [Solanum commersonii]
MDDWDKSCLGDEYSCKYCNGHHLDIKCPICHIAVTDAKQEAHNMNSFMECTDILDKVNSKITEQTFECVEELEKS